MDASQIRDRRRALLEELAIVEGEVAAVQTRLKTLQLVCDHPDEFHTSHMGQSCMHCPDCGHCP